MRNRRFYWAAALLSGALLAVAWPGAGGLTPLIFFAWVPLLLAEDRYARSPKEARPRNFIPYVMLALLLWNLATTWWLFHVSEHTATRLFTLIGPNVGNVLLMSLPWVLMRWARRGLGAWGARAMLVVAWIAFERFHMHWDLSWPWLTLGNVFAAQTQWVQWYELTGHLGGSVWIWCVNLAILRVALAPMGGAGRAINARTTIAAMLIVVPWGASWIRYLTFQEQGQTAEVVIVQPNIDPYNEKFGADPLEQLDRMLDQARPLMSDSTALVVLPETALQEATTLSNEHGQLVFHGLWENDMSGSRSVQRIRAFLQQYPGASLITGMSSARLYPPGAELPASARMIEGLGQAYEYYNAALMVRPDGTTEVYNKSKLVPGVELLPFEEVLGPLGWISVDLGGTTGSLGTQKERSVIRDGSGKVALAPTICYESIYGDHVAAHVRNGANVIVVMTNDGWWKDTPGYKQHLLYGKLRAVETRRDVARCANTGISCFIDQRGDMHQQTGWWVEAAIKGGVHTRTDLTFYVRYGDYIGKGAYAALLLLVLASIGAMVRKRKDGAAG